MKTKRRRLVVRQALGSPQYSDLATFETLPGARDLRDVLLNDADRAWFYRLGCVLRDPRSGIAAFVGAGISQSLGYWTWSQLLDRLHKLAFGKIAKADGMLRRYAKQVSQYEDITWRAQEYRDAIADERRYRGFLKKAFRPRGKKSASLDSLVRLPFRHFFTTNYDRELELAYQRQKSQSLDVVDWTDVDHSADLVARWNDITKPSCVYLHGCYTQPDRVVLTEKDYQRVYFRMNGNAQRLSAILLLHPVLFLGFSLSDPDLMALLRQANTLSLNGVRHFALIRLRTRQEIAGHFVERARLRRKYGVAAIFFRPGKGYIGLKKILNCLEMIDQWPTPQAAKLPDKVTEEYCYQVNNEFPNDPLKGRFGGISERGNWKVRARIGRDPDDARWFRVRVEVLARSTSRARLRGRVDFFVHPSFPQYRYYSFVKLEGIATYTFRCKGSFTLGVQVHCDKTFLELDLAEIDAAPLDFQFS